LRLALAESPDGFTEENLQKAFDVTHNKALVDIISMIKHATDRSSPLLTAQERVDAAVAVVVERRELTPEQERWMEYIRDHLVANLTIDLDDFDNVPVLMNRGGRGRASRVFDGHLLDLIDALNAELAAA